MARRVDMARPADREGRTVDLDDLAALEGERAFLLGSLRDLEAEHAAGDVDEHDYVTLRDGYTKRAADVLRQIDVGTAALAPREPPVGVAAGDRRGPLAPRPPGSAGSSPTRRVSACPARRSPVGR